MEKDIMNFTFDSDKEQQLVQQVQNFKDVKQMYFELNKKILQKEVIKNQHVIQKAIQQSKKTNNQSLSKSLEALLQDSNSQHQFKMYQASISEIKPIIKLKIQNALKSIPQETLKFYQSVLKQYQQLKHSLDLKFKVTSSIEQLIKLDILSIFFYTCREKFNSVLLINAQQIQQFLEIDLPYYKKYLLFYKRVQPLVQFKWNEDIKDSILLLGLLRAKLRIMSKYKRQDYQYATRIKHFAGRLIKPHTQFEEIFEHYKYNFCELAFLFRYREKESFSQQSYLQVIASYKSVCSEQSLQLRKMKLLVMKAKFKISFLFLFKSLWYVQNNQQQKIKKQIQHFQEIKKLQKILPYIFLQYKSFEQAFQKSKIDKILGMKTFGHYVSNQRQCAAASIVVVAYKRFKLASSMISAQLTLEKVSRKFLVIKRYQFSYQQLKGIKRDKKTDLVLTLILGTDSKRIQFFCIKKGQILSRKYLTIVVKLIANIKKKNDRFCLIVFENEFSKGLPFYEFVSLTNIIKTTYNSHAYLTNNSQYCELNNFLHIYLKYKISLFARTTNEKTFYSLVEEFIKQELTNFACCTLE